MKTKALATLTLAATLAGCAGNPANDAASVSVVSTSPVASCNLPDVTGSGPIRPPMYVTGTFSDGQWMHQEHRRMSYKGDGIYQVIMDNEAGPVNFQFASMGWKPQFTVSGGRLNVGQEGKLVRGGFMKDTHISFNESGRYVWGFQVDADGKPMLAAIAQCAE